MFFNNSEDRDTNFNKTYVPKRYKELDLRNKPKLILSKEVLSQIAYYHSKYKKEWSGFLLFEQQGDLNRISEMVLTAKYIHLLDLGSETFTEISEHDPFTVTDDIGDRALSYKMGIIHTHHKMSTFFSGTDTGCLHENAENFPFLLSLIVNFEADYKAKVAFVANASESVKSIKLNPRLGGTEVTMGEAKNEEVLVLCECEIIFDVEESVLKRYKIIEETPKRAPYYTAVPRHTPQSAIPAEHKSYTGQSEYNKNVTLDTIDLSMEKVDKFLIKCIERNEKPAGYYSIYLPLLRINRVFGYGKEAEKKKYFHELEDDIEVFANNHYGKVLSIIESSALAAACIIRLRTHEKEIPIAAEVREIFELFCMDEPEMNKTGNILVN